jgi:hypothetical protein
VKLLAEVQYFVSLPLRQRRLKKTVQISRFLAIDRPCWLIFFSEVFVKKHNDVRIENGT